MRMVMAIVAAALALGAHGAERSIAREVVVKAPVEAVWMSWTTSEGIQSFFAPEARVEARPDGAFHVHFNPYAPPGAKGADDMRVLAVQEKKLISFTWNAPPHLPEVRAQRTFVTVRLAPASPTETRVSLHHSGWGEGSQWEQAYDYFDRAWGSVLANLQKSFSDGPIDWKPFLARMKSFQDEEDRKAGRKPPN